MAAFLAPMLLFTTTECSKQIVYIATRKIVELLSCWNIYPVDPGVSGSSGSSRKTLALTEEKNSSSIFSSGTDNNEFTKFGMMEKIDMTTFYNQKIQNFLERHHIYLKLSITMEILRERTQPDRSNISDLIKTPKPLLLTDASATTSSSSTSSTSSSSVSKEEKSSGKFDRCESKAIEVACIVLEKVLGKILRELGLLHSIVLSHEKQKYVYHLRTPDYEKHLSRISALMENDFEVCFQWLERAIRCRRQHHDSISS